MKKIITDRTKLKQISEDCEVKEAQKIVRDMQEVVAKHPNGAGISAPQIGVFKKVILICARSKNLTLINPKILSSSKDKNKLAEGCLCVPDVLVFITRPKHVTVEYTDYNGNIIATLFDDVDSRIIQHEMDHLAGKTILDYITVLN